MRIFVSPPAFNSRQYLGQIFIIVIIIPWLVFFGQLYPLAHGKPLNALNCCNSIDFGRTSRAWWKIKESHAASWPLSVHCFAIWMGKSTAVNFFCYMMGLQDPLDSKFHELITPGNTAFERSIDVWTYGLSRAPSALGSTENICRIQSLQTVRKTQLTFLAYDDEKNGWKTLLAFLEFHYFFVPCLVSSLSCILLRKFL